jgi:hypothetical protein
LRPHDIDFYLEPDVWADEEDDEPGSGIQVSSVGWVPAVL